ncbi:MAG: outer membrane protein assembly factor BamA [Deltaproteobacteria bacterium CG11_big_fil_rev_8_21_14_0_20_49_13]|nr:MAG: outer membrane protein assembly factor BamA [Deltaproteobacteria bacterium CG11_big_fil_rev_8_21_14_0_20_49_13]
MELYMRRDIKHLILTFAFAFLFLNVTVGTAFAAGTVTAINVKGNFSVTPETILATIKTKRGMQYSRDRLQEDVKSLWALGQFRDIIIDRSDMGGGIVLTIIVVEKPIITKVDFKGNKKLKNDDLEKEVTIRNYRPLNGKDLAESITKMREAYAKKNYYLVNIDYRITPTQGNEAELTFDINEHDQAIVRKVEFIGNHAYRDKELRGKIKTKEKTSLSWMTGGGKYKEDQLEQDVMMLTFFYLQNGYIKIKVDSPKVAISKDRRYIFITFYVEEGKQYKIDDIQVEGDVLTTPEQLKSILSVEKGTVYNQRTVEEDMMKLISFYGESGYAFVNVRPDTDPNDETLTTPLIFRIEKGNRIMVERININGNTTTRDKVIRREMLVKESDIYNTRLIEESKQRLQQLGFFEEVNFATPRGSTDDKLVLNITVKEKPTGTFNVGAGFSTAENFIISASIAKENFFGYGIGGQLSAELSGKRQQFMLDYRDPYFLDTQWMLSASVYRTLYRYDDFARKSYGGSFSIGHRIFEHSSVSLGYQLESVRVDDFSYIVPAFFKEDASGVTSEAILTVARDTRDNRIFPTKGMYHMIESEVSGSKLGGDNDFYRISGNSRFYYPLFWGIVAKANAKIGYVESLNNGPVPLFERYFTGGVYSLRGFMPRSIGPKLQIPSSPSGTDSEFVYGGNKLLLFNGELEFPIYMPAGIRWVFFLDAGNAFAEQQNYSLTNIRTDWGLGLRWNSPIGPLRFEWGIPFSRQPGEDPVVFNFTIGSLF